MAKYKRKFSNIELSFFCNQLAMILSAGISSIEGFTMMAEDSQNDEEKEILSEILTQLEMGQSLYDTFNETGLFPVYLLQMVKIGEETGKLDEVFSSLAQHYHREDSIKNSIRHALTYPLIMTAMMILVVMVLLIKVMPVFNQVFIQLGSEMTGFAGLLVSLGDSLSKYVLIVITTILVIAAILYFFGKRMIQRIPFTRIIYERIAACKFASGMALALSSGLNPDLSMELVCQLNEDALFEKKLLKCKELLYDGEDFSKALLLSGIFTGLYARMASIGDKSGNLDQIMQQIADNCQEDADNHINQLLAIIEPTLVVSLSLAVGTILLSVMFPLIGIMSNL